MSADLIIRNIHFPEVDFPEGSDTLAITAGRISAIGRHAEFVALAGPQTQLIDAGHQGLYRALTVIAALGTVLAAAYLLWLYQRTAFGRPTEEFAGLGADGHADHGHADHGHADHAGHGDHEPLHDVSRFEWWAWTPLLVAIVVFGVYPQLMFKIMDPAVTQLFGK